MTDSTDLDNDEPRPTPPPTARQRFRRLIAALARDLDESSEHPLPRGLVVALRREDGGMSPRFYDLASSMLEEDLARWPGEPDLTEAERRWARVVWVLAQLAGQHRPGISFGTALARARVAEPRVVRLLRAQGDALHAAVRAVVPPLLQQAIELDLTDIAALILSAPEPMRPGGFHAEEPERVRRRIARDFYRALRQTTDNRGDSE